MSSSIIEAKFQALDQTVRLLTKAKVASSDHLRELVYGQQQKQHQGQRQREPKREDADSASRLSSASAATRRPNARSGSANAPAKKTTRCQSGKGRVGAGPVWIDPKQQRAQQILEDTWNVRKLARTGKRA